MKKLLLFAFLVSIAAIAAYFAKARPPKTRSLRTYDQLIFEAASPVEKEEILLSALEILVDKEVPGSLKTWVVSSYMDSCKNLLPKLTAQIDSLQESVLGGESPIVLPQRWSARFFFTLPYVRLNLPSDSVQHIFSAASQIYRSDSSFSHSLSRLEGAFTRDDSAYYKSRLIWYMSSTAGSRQVQGDFEGAKTLAILGLQHARSLPDSLQIITLCIRLQNAVFYGESLVRFSRALGEWIVKESKEQGYLRPAVSMLYNLGDQNIAIERFESAYEFLKETEILLQENKTALDTSFYNWYQKQSLERFAAIFRTFGEQQRSLEYLQQYHEFIENDRDRILYHNQYGMAERDIGNLENAKIEFERAIEIASRIKHDGKLVDAYNLYIAILNLAELYLKNNLHQDARLTLKRWDQYISRFEYTPKINATLKVQRDILHAEILHALKRGVEAKKRLDRAMLVVDSLEVNRATIEFALSASGILAELYGFPNAQKRLHEAIGIANDEKLLLRKLDLKIIEFGLTPPDRNPNVPLREFEEIIAEIRGSENYNLLPKAMVAMIKFALRQNKHELALQYAQETLEVIQLVGAKQRTVDGVTFYNHSTHNALKTALECFIQLGKSEEAYVYLTRFKSRALQNALGELGEKGMEIAEVQDLLRPGETVIDFLAGDKLYAFVTRKDYFSVKTLEITRIELQRRISEYSNTVSDSLPANLDSAEAFKAEYLRRLKMSHNLYNKVFDSILDALPAGEKLFIIPDAYLFDLPFATLANDSTPDAAFLIEKHPIAYLPGAWVLRQRKKDAASSIHAAIQASVTPSFPGSSVILKHLRQQCTNCSMTTGWKSLAALEEALKNGSDSFLFYGHASASWENPERSFIEFPMADSTHGKLYAGMLDALDLSTTNCVILGGCETTGSRIYRGSGIVGLQRSFLMAGVKQVVATNWNIYSREAAATLVDFFRTRKTQPDPAVALQIAQKNAIARARKKSLLFHPFPHLWGAYSIYGIAPNDSTGVVFHRAQ